MASFHAETTVDLAPEELWARVADAGKVSELLGAVAESSLDGDIRRVTMTDGRELTERIISVDHDNRRVAYTVLDGIPVDFHAASMQVLDAGGGRATLRWITNVVPDEAVEGLGSLFQAEMDGLAARL